MCIAILNKNTELSRESLRNCWEANNHGAGILYTYGERLLRFTELNDFDAYYQGYVEARRTSAFPMLLHFRISTSGKVNDDNCHPFLVPGTDWGLVHNGMLNVHSTKEYSDTWHFANYYCAQFKDPSNAWAREIMLELAGTYNKLLFLNAAGEYFIINEREGHWDEAKDTWYSNSSYKERGVTYYGNERRYIGGRGRDYDWDNFRRGLDEEDDDARYARRGLGVSAPVRTEETIAEYAKEYVLFCNNGTRLKFRDTKKEADYQSWASALPWTLDAPTKAMLKDEYEARQANPDERPYANNLVEAQYLAYAKMRADVSPVKGATGTAKYSNEQLTLFAQARDKYTDFPHWDDPEFDAKYSAWVDRYRDQPEALEGVKKSPSGSAGSSVTAPDAVGCVHCGSYNLEFDEYEEAHWCYNCDSYLEPEDTFDVGGGTFLESVPQQDFDAITVAHD